MPSVIVCFHALAVAALLLHFPPPAESYCVPTTPIRRPRCFRPDLAAQCALARRETLLARRTVLGRRRRRLVPRAAKGSPAQDDDDGIGTFRLFFSTVKNAAQRVKRKKWKLERERGMSRTPFREYVNVRSIVRRCLLTIAAYLTFGSVAYRFVLQRESWTLVDSLYFCVATFTTAGFGDLAPTTFAAKAFTIVYSLSGVSIIGAAIAVIWKNILDAQDKAVAAARNTARVRVMQLFEHRGDDGAEEDEELCIDEDYLLDGEEVCCLADEECILEGDSNDEIPFIAKEATTLRGTIARAVISQLPTLMVLTTIGSFLAKAEGWSAFQTVYFGVSTATTIGYGDVVAQTQRARVLATIFLPLSVFSLGEILSSAAGFQISKAAAKAEKAFMRRVITSDDLEIMDVNRDGEVDEADFISFMLVAMNKVDRSLIDDLKRLFRALDVGKDGFLRKEDLFILAQRKLNARRMRRKARTKAEQSQRNS